MTALQKLSVLAILGIMGCGYVQPAFAWSTESSNISGSFASVADPDDQQPALVNSGDNVNSNPAEQDMDRIANDAQAPQVTGPSSLHTNFSGFSPGRPYLYPSH